ncbi:hypothetical protein IMZ48_36625 [Candidatus Bathyarchaeota archaeon]|nr:hypothetical protein [Candidatus Bathyarchaeota archaeon]
MSKRAREREPESPVAAGAMQFVLVVWRFGRFFVVVVSSKACADELRRAQMIDYRLSRRRKRKTNTPKEVVSMRERRGSLSCQSTTGGCKCAKQ